MNDSVAGWERPVARGLYHRQNLRAEFHRARDRERVFDAHLGRDERSEECGQQFESEPVALGMKRAETGKKWLNILDLREDLSRAIAP
jgi:hypothetical protein